MKYQLRFIAIGATLRRARSQINIRSKPLLLLLLSIGAILNIFLHIPTRFGVNDLGIDARWFVELENQFRLGHLLGRDVHFTYGPLAQVLAWLASFVRANDSALYGYGIGNAVFEIVAVIALVLSLAMIKQIREGGTLFIFVMYVPEQRPVPAPADCAAGYCSLDPDHRSAASTTTHHQCADRLA